MGKISVKPQKPRASRAVKVSEIRTEMGAGWREDGRRAWGKKQGKIIWGLRNHTEECALCSKSNVLEARKSF